ncbi:MAG: hypothetical protein AAGB15_01580 [Pseudomonadota bacterium]
MDFPTDDDAVAHGAEPVGNVSDISTDEMRLLRCIRLWMVGPGYQELIWETLTRDRGTSGAKLERRALEGFMSNIAVSIDRRLARHGVACGCLGRDEAILLAIVRKATMGDRYSATVHAAGFVRADRVDVVVDAAEWLGQTMGQVSMTHGADPVTLFPGSAPGTIH